MSDVIISSRTYLRKQVTETFNSRSTFSSLSQTEKKTKRLLLNDKYDKLESLNSQIQNIKFKDDINEISLNDEFKKCEEYNCKIRTCIALLDDSVSNNSNATNTSQSEARSLLRSPTAPLPIFKSEDGEDFTKFILEFEDTISKFKYSDYDKLLLLKQQVNGRAKILLASLDSTNQSYNDAKKLLEDALASPTTRKHSTIKQLTKLKLDYKDEPFEFVSKLKTIIESINKLKITTDDFVLYFAWQGLNDSFKTHLVNITCNTRPSLQEITSNYFDACERYREHQSYFKKQSKEKEQFSLAANINYEQKSKFKNCVLCDSNSNNHSTFQCRNYPTVESKVKRINELKGCTRCGYLNHQITNCKFKFKSRCRLCDAWHMTYLCTASNDNKVIAKTQKNDTKDSKETKGKSKINNKAESFSTTMTITTVLECDLNENSILPTFMCTIGGSTIRCLRDGGCQVNLISEQILDKLNCATIKRNVNITINGINGPKNYSSKIVEAKFSFGSKDYILRAFTLPRININIELTGLSFLAQNFIQRGHKLADENLLRGSDSIKDIGFILGSGSGYCLPGNDIVFGTDNKSIYSQTPIGILLSGNIIQLLNDVKFIPEKFDEIGVYETAIDCRSDNFCIDLGLKNSNDECMDKEFESVRDKILKAKIDILDSEALNYLNVDDRQYDCSVSEANQKMIEFVLNNTVREESGRLRMPLMWKTSNSHLLGQNLNLSKSILKTNLNKLRKNPEHLKLADNVFKEQLELGIIEKIPNMNQFLTEHPESSFLAHMCVFKLDRATTKCRVVYLSNLCEKDASKPLTVSHNQAIESGPNLNQKLTTSLTHLRFGSKLCCFDIRKAFNNINLSDADANRLLFLWFRNVEGGDFTIEAYRHLRLNFGLRCSPTLLLLALYKILILDSIKDDFELRERKKLIFQLSYMDNCAISGETEEDILDSFNSIFGIFNPYKFEIQQYITNDSHLRDKIREIEEISEDPKVKLLGIQWDTVNDTLSTKPISLDPGVTTKRGVLATLASQFDPFNYNCPLLNRSRLFCHSLQCQKDLGWDDCLSNDQISEWKTIAKQANDNPTFEVPRNVGKRVDQYKIVAFSDSSKALYGCVLYLQNLGNLNVSFAVSKNKVINKNLSDKSIPSLELLGIYLAAKTSLDLYKELGGPLNVCPIKINEIEIYSDSLVAISWINSYVNKFDKMNKISVFVKNQLLNIVRVCEEFPITFSFISGEENPADFTTRCTSYKILSRTNYFSGPEFLKNCSEANSRKDIIRVQVPNPCTSSVGCVALSPVCDIKNENSELIKFENYSSFNKIVNIMANVYKFIHKLRAGSNRIILNCSNDHFKNSFKFILMQDQKNCFNDILDYFRFKNVPDRDIPELVLQLNLFVDDDGLLRVKAKCEKLLQTKFNREFPVLLSNTSRLTELLIMDLHKKLSHASKFTLLNELKKKFWLPKCFSTVNKILKNCVICKRLNERSIKLNQNSYRLERLDPVNIPFCQIYVDYIGPFFVYENKEKIKKWLLCLTCMWSRSINLKICDSLSVDDFLRALQIHSFEFGLPQYFFSDLGTQLVAGGNIIKNFLNDPETDSYFSKTGIKPINFEHYYKGHSELGSLVESCVKIVKKLIFGSIKKNVLNVKDFNFLISKVVYLANHRPVAFKDSLTGSSIECPDPITPDLLIRGYSIDAINVIPNLQQVPVDEDWVNQESTERIKNSYHKLNKVRADLIKNYNEEFLNNLIDQSVSKKSGYKPVLHKRIKCGDIVLLKEELLKSSQYPMGIIKDVTVNSLGEVTGAKILKGSTKELVKRHSSVIIPLLSNDDPSDIEPVIEQDNKAQVKKLPEREAAKKCRIRNKLILDT